jgi:hypothetical protein
MQGRLACQVLVVIQARLVYLVRMVSQAYQVSREKKDHLADQDQRAILVLMASLG